MQVSKEFYCYILTNQAFGTLYIGYTANLNRRLFQHQARQSIFTAKYALNKLVWFERHLSKDSAIYRELQLKRWKRDWKINLIHAFNPSWDDLFPAFDGPLPAQGSSI